MVKFPTEKQLTALGFLAANEEGYSSIELAKLLKMNKSNFSRIVLKPSRDSGWIKTEKSHRTGYPGRPKEILKITRDLSKIWEIMAFNLKRINESELENIEIHKEANEHMHDVDFDPELWDARIEAVEASLVFYEKLGSIFYELHRNSIHDLTFKPIKDMAEILEKIREKARAPNEA